MYRDKCPECYGNLIVNEKSQIVKRLRKNPLKIEPIDNSFLANIDRSIGPLIMLFMISSAATWLTGYFFASIDGVPYPYEFRLEIVFDKLVEDYWDYGLFLLNYILGILTLVIIFLYIILRIIAKVKGVKLNKPFGIEED
ncbi:MAG: hypothetical protein HeimC3_20460 [Candidatus Heimdallarchaeota archaeon LC_3]|nr:MAG: hypothetical protein HeimC3_20460 [Candidatus Heimdallarchaeota archaeon LC_3]